MREAGRPCPDLEGIECEEYPFDKQMKERHEKDGITEIIE